MSELKNKKIELRHEAIQELLGTLPGWLIRWGITLFSCILALLVLGSYFFRYPETVKASITITTEHPSVWIVAKSSGNIDSIYVKNHDFIKKGDLIAVIHNTAHIDDIEKLNEALDSIRKFIVSFAIEDIYVPQQELKVGELQKDYAQLVKLLNDHLVFGKNNINEIKIASMQKELAEQEILVRQAQKQVDLYSQYSIINKKQYQRDSILFSNQAAMAIEKEESEMKVLNGKIQLEQVKQNAIQGNISILRLRQSIDEYTAEINMQSENYRTNIRVAYEQLRSYLWNWEQTYLLKAPSNGIVSFSAYWGKGQPIAVGEKSFSIVPHNSGRIIGKCKIPVTGAGKIKRGQRVIIKLNEYPYMEFGLLEGVVGDIYLIPMEKQSATGIERFGIVDVAFPKALTSIYRKAIPFPGELTGEAEIAVNELSLLEHLLRPFKYLIHK